MTTGGSIESGRFQELEAEYDFLRELGRGATAVVYLARERELRRQVAIKVLRSNQPDDGEAVARLAREARLVALLRHPNIVPLLSTRHLSDGSLALIMQHVPGMTLKNVLREQGPSSIPLVEQVLREIGMALDYAHRRHNIVHRDIKPENIYLDEECGRALLADFGIARTAEAETSLTLVGTALGTPAYMSPEQIDGLRLDGRSDLYSLGLVAYEMLTGQQPWAGCNLYTIIYKQKNDELPPLRQFRPDVPPYLERAIGQLLRKDRVERYTDAAQFVSQLPHADTSIPPFLTPKREAIPTDTVSEDAPTLRYDRPGTDALAASAPLATDENAADGADADSPPARPAAWELVEPIKVPAEPRWERVERAPGRSYSIKKEPVAPVSLPVERPRAQEWGDTGIAALYEDDVAAAMEPRLLAALQSHKGLRLLAAASVFVILSVTATIVALISRSRDPDLQASALPAVGAPVTRWQVGNDTTAQIAFAEKSAVSDPVEKPTSKSELPRESSKREQSKASKSERSEESRRAESERKPIEVPSVKPPEIATPSVSRALSEPAFSFGETAKAVASQPAPNNAKTVASQPVPNNAKSVAGEPVPKNDTGPVFTVFTVAPELANRATVQRALERNYPRRLRESGVGGTVMLWALIDERGRVVRSQVKSGSGIEVLDRAAINVADAMQFTPARNQDQPVKVWVELPMVFKTK